MTNNPKHTKSRPTGWGPPGAMEGALYASAQRLSTHGDARIFIKVIRVSRQRILQEWGLRSPPERGRPAPRAAGRRRALRDLGRPWFGASCRLDIGTAHPHFGATS